MCTGKYYCDIIATANIGEVVGRPGEKTHSGVLFLLYAFCTSCTVPKPYSFIAQPPTMGDLDLSH